jgi:hypothetical protein
MKSVFQPAVARPILRGMSLAVQAPCYRLITIIVLMGLSIMLKCVY